MPGPSSQLIPVTHSQHPLYPRRVSSRLLQRQTPTAGLLFGLIVTVAAVIAYSCYITIQISGLKELQRNLADRNRKDSLQLIRIQNNLNSLALAMRDMLDNDEPHPLTAWSAQFQRIRVDLDNALRREEKVAIAPHTAEQRQYLADSLLQFWDAVDRTFALAGSSKEKEARTQIRLSLQARQAALNTAVARQLIENNESEEQAALRVGEIYEQVQRQVYLFLTAILTGILLTSLYIIRSNRLLFARLSSLSEQRSELAQKLITTQESTLRYISRELHDEFGQILTAIGSMLARTRNHIPEGSPLRAELREVSDIAQSTLNNVRSLSQALHPVILEEGGLVSALDWYLPTLEKQTGLDLSYEKSGAPFSIESNVGIHIYRVAQEALNNIVRHSGSAHAWVRLRFLREALILEVEDRGTGFMNKSTNHGIGLVAMRERAELLGGTVEFLRPPEGGTLVRLTVPSEKASAGAE